MINITFVKKLTIAIIKSQKFWNNAHTNDFIHKIYLSFKKKTIYIDFN